MWNISSFLLNYNTGRFWRTWYLILQDRGNTFLWNIRSCLLNYNAGCWLNLKYGASLPNLDGSRRFLLNVDTSLPKCKVKVQSQLRESFVPRTIRLEFIGIKLMLEMYFTDLFLDRTEKGKGKGKYKVVPVICNEGTEGEQSCRSILSSTSALDGGGWLTPLPGHFAAGNESVPITQEAGWTPGCGKSLPHRGSTPDSPARNESISRLHRAGCLNI